jgi:tryptophan synthase alpha chain
MTKQNDRIAEMFARQKALGKKALITFITAGDPNIETTKRLVLEMAAAGANLVELGVPFSDPVAEGPIIQAADLRALSKGLRTDAIFDAVAELRGQTETPIVFMMYINCIYTYGKEKFFARCAECGVDGVIVPDLPFEEKDEVREEAAKYKIKLISLVAPTSHDRAGMIAREAEGFLYCVSSEGVTGVRKSFSTDFESYFAAINKSAKVPTAIGFGISGPEQAKALQKYADGIIVGSAIVRLVGAAKDGDNAVRSVSDFVRALRAAMDE